MPLVTLTVHDSTPAAQRRQLLDAVHNALVAVGVPPADRFQRVIALDGDSFVVDPGYPDAARPRDARFAIVEVLWSVGRSVKIKRQFLQHLGTALVEAGHDPENLMLVFKETAWENWSFAGGRLLHA
jgi:phenylpyruvate tautomerase PptA (4-oxalocrotonate tautomerase family)